MRFFAWRVDAQDAIDLTRKDAIVDQPGALESEGWPWGKQEPRLELVDFNRLGVPF